MTQKSKSLQPRSWVWISTAAFGVSVTLAILFMVHAQKLSSRGLTLTTYYLILIPFGLSVAAFLFGAMRSYARYVGKFSFGQLELTGPVVVFAMVVAGGMYLAKPQETFLLTVRVHGPGGRADIIKSGSVILDLGSQRITKDLNESGEIHFAEVPQKFSSRKIELLPQVEGFQRIEAEWPQTITANKIIYLALKPVKSIEVVKGMVVDRNGNPLANVDIILEGGKASAKSDAQGLFSLNIKTNPGETFRLSARLNNRIGYNDYVTIPKNQTLIIKVDK